MEGMIKMWNFEVGAQQGWQCPVCKRVYAPFVTKCLYCERNTVTNIGSEISQPLIDWCRHTSYTGTDMPKVTLEGTEFDSKTSIVNMFREICGSEDCLGMG